MWRRLVVQDGKTERHSFKFHMMWDQEIRSYTGMIITEGSSSEDSVLKECVFGYHGSAKNKEMSIKVFEYRYYLIDDLHCLPIFT